jgi:hypothetical protein
MGRIETRRFSWVSALAAEFGDDRFHDAVQVVHHIRRRKADHTHASPGKVCVAALVSAEFDHIVRPAIDLHSELLLRAIEIDGPWANRMLSAEAPTARLAISERLPQLDLWRRHGAPESLRPA